MFKQKFTSYLLRTVSIACSIILLCSCATEGASTQTQDDYISANYDAEKAAKVICIDAGHGVGDVGAVVNASDVNETEIYEKDINLAISLYVVQALESMGYTVVMARGADDEEPLCGYDENGKGGIVQRVTWANEEEFDLYISIHCNTFTDTSVSGTRLYYNKSNNGSDNKALCDKVKKSLSKNMGIESNTYNEADLYAVTATNMPALLIESGFITNDDDLAKLLDEQWQNDFAKSIAIAIDDYLT